MSFYDAAILADMQVLLTLDDEGLIWKHREKLVNRTRMFSTENARTTKASNTTKGKE